MKHLLFLSRCSPRAFAQVNRLALTLLRNVGIIRKWARRSH